MAHIFISYSKKDTRALAVSLFQSLNTTPGLTAWMDTSLEPASSWAMQIQDEIDRADFVVVLLSPDVNRKHSATLRRSFVLNEIDYSQQQNKPVLPVMAQPTKVPVQLAGMQFIDLTQNHDAAFHHLIDYLCKISNVQNPARPNPPRLSTDRKRGSRSLLTLAVALVVIAFVGIGALILLTGDGGGANDGEITQEPTVPAAVELTSSSTLLPEQLALIPATSNDQWTPFERDFDRVTMVLVPAGCFRMGDTRGDDDELPVHEQCFERPFWIDKVEVTNLNYGFTGSFAGSTRPRDNIRWADADAFCRRIGGRLPTEAEWEFAARGPDNRIFPWGDDFVASNLVWSLLDDGSTHRGAGDGTETVGSRPDGASWVGAQDMSGNLWEWTSSIYQPYPFVESTAEAGDGAVNHVLRGGDWHSDQRQLRAANRYGDGIPLTGLDGVGFRCARDYEG